MIGLIDSCKMPVDYKKIAKENVRRYGTEVDKYGRVLLAERYSDRTHFVYELLQNAEDAIRWRDEKEGREFEKGVEFRLYDDRLEFRHFGLPFSTKHVRSICSIADSSKVQDYTAIGKHGIGFKSVYAYTKSPIIRSGNEHFVIESYVRPQGIEQKKLEENETVFEIPFDHDVIDSQQACDEIEKRFKSLDIGTLLFLDHIESISIQYAHDQHRVLRRKESQITESLKKISLSDFGNQERLGQQEDWIVATETIVYRSRQVGKVAIAFKLLSNRDDHSSVTISPVRCPPLFVYFPTEKETHFGFLVQGPYRTTPSRDNVPTDDSWNQKLIQITAALLKRVIPELAQKHMSSIGGLLETLMHDRHQSWRWSETDFFAPISEAIIDCLKNERVFKSTGNDFREGRRACIAASKSIRKSISPSTLKQLTNSDEKPYWIHQAVVDSLNSQTKDFLASKVGIRVIDVDFLVQQFSEDSLKRKPDKWLLNFYEVLADNAKHLNSLVLRNAPIIRLSDGSHVKYSQHKPNAFFQSEFSENLPTVKPEVCCTEKSQSLLESLGVSEATLFDEVTRNILPRYEEEAKEIPTTYKRDFERILDLYESDLENRGDLLWELRSKYWVPTICKKQESARLSSPNNHPTYFPIKELRQLFSDSPEVRFVDGKKRFLLSDRSKEFLEACGISKTVQRDEIFSPKTSEIDLWQIRQKSGLQNHTWERIEDYEIVGLEEVLSAIEKERLGWQTKALMLWKCLDNALRANGPEFAFGTYRWGYNKEKKSATFPAAFLRRLSEAKWILDKQKRPRRASDICFKEISEDFAKHANGYLVRQLPFKNDTVAQLAKEAGVDQKIIEVLKKFDGLSAEELSKLLEERLRQKKSLDTSIEISMSRKGERIRSQSLSESTEPEQKASDKSHTANRREESIESLAKKIQQKSSMGMVAPGEENADHDSAGRFQKDDEYRRAVLQYEIKAGREPVEKSERQPGHDVDSFAVGNDGKDRKLIRRIEIKGKSARWVEDEIVEISIRQFEDAKNLWTDDKENLHPDFDYWVYVVEKRDVGQFFVVPLRNPAATSYKFELRGGTWRPLAQKPSIVRIE